MSRKGTQATDRQGFAIDSAASLAGRCATLVDLLLVTKLVTR
jgi:hypothetical protein